MPNRIIKESICTSEKIASLSDLEFRLWVGLLTYVDDAGRGDARPAIIKGRVFPLRERVSNKDIEALLHRLAAKGCVSLYTVGGKPYLWFPTWGEHQRIRDVKPKHPGPEEADVPLDGLRSSAADCGEEPQSAAKGGLNPNPNPNPNSNSKERGGAAPFTRPTVEEIRAYCRERENAVDPQRFFDYYEANGWVQGKGKPIKDWKAMVRTWEGRETTRTNGPTYHPPSQAELERSRQSAQLSRRVLEMLKEEESGERPEGQDPEQIV